MNTLEEIMLDYKKTLQNEKLLIDSINLVNKYAYGAVIPLLNQILRMLKMETMADVVDFVKNEYYTGEYKVEIIKNDKEQDVLSLKANSQKGDYGYRVDVLLSDEIMKDSPEIHLVGIIDYFKINSLKGYIKKLNLNEIFENTIDFNAARGLPEISLKTQIMIQKMSDLVNSKIEKGE